MQKNKFCPKNTALKHLRAYFNGNGLENPKIVIFKVKVTSRGHLESILRSMTHTWSEEILNFLKKILRVNLFF